MLLARKEHNFGFNAKGTKEKNPIAPLSYLHFLWSAACQIDLGLEWGTQSSY